MIWTSHWIVNYTVYCTPADWVSWSATLIRNGIRHTWINLGDRGVSSVSSYWKISSIETWGFLGASVVKNHPAKQETQVWSLSWEDPPGEGNCNPLQYSCLENHIDRGAWWATVHGVIRVGHDLVTKPAPPNNKLKGGLKWRHSLIKQKQLPSKSGWKPLNSPCYLGGSEKAMAPHSSTLAWEIPWMEEPGGLQSLGSLRVGHDWATSLSLFIFMHWRRKWQPTPVILPGESQGRGSLVGCHLWGRTESDTTDST